MTWTCKAASELPNVHRTGLGPFLVPDVKTFKKTSTSKVQPLFFLPVFPPLPIASVEEALAGFLPAAGCAPLVSVLDAVNLTTLFGLAANPPEKTRRQKGQRMTSRLKLHAHERKL